MSKYWNFVCLKNELKLTLNLPKVIREIRGVLNEPTVWEGMPRKRYHTRLKENVLWYMKNKEACIYYNSYGFDIIGFRDKKTYMPYRQFRIARNKEDYPRSIYESKMCLLRDKIAFAAFFSDLLGEQYIVKTQGKLAANGFVYDYITKRTLAAETYFASVSSDLFVKKLNGECGDGCYIFTPGDDCRKILNAMRGSEYIIQKRVVQHDRVNEINSSCINTIRIVTIVGKNSGEPAIFGHYMRVGCNTINDNRATGGVGVAITNEGLMAEYGVGHHKVEKCHSVTGHIYLGTEIPYWNEVKQLVLKAHSSIPEIPTIGWDVAITPQGPVLIEGNDNWEISGIQDTMGGMKQRWYDLHNA